VSPAPLIDVMVLRRKRGRGDGRADNDLDIERVEQTEMVGRALVERGVCDVAGRGHHPRQDLPRVQGPKGESGGRRGVVGGLGCIDISLACLACVRLCRNS
jgi:hypothetical protein